MQGTEGDPLCRLPGLVCVHCKMYWPGVGTEGKEQARLVGEQRAGAPGAAGEQRGWGSWAVLLQLWMLCCTVLCRASSACRYRGAMPCQPFTLGYRPCCASPVHRVPHRAGPTCQAPHRAVRWEAAEGWAGCSCSPRHLPAQPGKKHVCSGQFHCSGFHCCRVLHPIMGKSASSGKQLIIWIPSERRLLHNVEGRKAFDFVHFKKDCNACPLLPPLPNETLVPHKGFIIAMQHSPSPATSSSACWATFRGGAPAAAWSWSLTVEVPEPLLPRCSRAPRSLQQSSWTGAVLVLQLRGGWNHSTHPQQRSLSAAKFFNFI